MNGSQPGILAPVPPLSRYLELGTLPDADPAPALRALAALEVDEGAVIGLGPGLIRGFGRTVEGLRPFPALSGPGCEVPSTQADVWIWLRGDDRGHIAHRCRALARVLDAAFRCDVLVDGFMYDGGLDLAAIGL